MINKIFIQVPIDKLVKFFAASLAGVVIDLVLFKVLIGWGFGIVFTNYISSFCAICATYLISTHFAFRKKAEINMALIFTAYYFCSISFFSYAILITSAFLQVKPFLCKVISLPISFLINFTFVNFLILGKNK